MRFFEAAGGVPAIARTDRMGALGSSQGRRFRLHAPTLEFARAHGVEVSACAAGDSARKGKVERPFRDVKESLLEELEVLGVPADVGELNRRAQSWLGRRMNARPHRVTDAVPDERLRAERSLLAPVPRVRFDTAYVEVRRVHPKLPLIEWDELHYSVPPDGVGQLVEVRLPVDARVLEVRWAGRVIARHRLGNPGDSVIWDPAHRAAAEAAALAKHRPGRGLRLVSDHERVEAQPLRLDVAGDVEVAAPDLAIYAVAAADLAHPHVERPVNNASEGFCEDGFRGGEGQ